MLASTQCFYLFLAISAVLGPSFAKQKKQRTRLENDVLEKSEVMLKFPTYALKMPPIVASRKRLVGSKVDPEPVSCTSNNVTKSLNALRKRIKCVPRETVVEVSAPDGSAVVPNTVVVNRCGGMCSGGKKCLPKKKSNAEFYVRSIQQKSTLVFCSRILVPEDVECHCACDLKKKCPSSDQKFDNTLCKCVCTNKDENQECLNKASIDPNFKWSAKTCSCVCKHQKLCTTGTVWMPDKCKCIKP